MCIASTTSLGSGRRRSCLADPRARDHLPHETSLPKCFKMNFMFFCPGGLYKPLPAAPSRGRGSPAPPSGRAPGGRRVAEGCSPTGCTWSPCSLSTTSKVNRNDCASKWLPEAAAGDKDLSWGLGTALLITQIFRGSCDTTHAVYARLQHSHVKG